MNKKQTSLLLCALINMSLIPNTYAHNKAKNLWESIALVGSALAIGVGAYKLLEWCLTETNEQLLARTEREYKDTLRFVEDGTLAQFESFHNLTRITIQETYPVQYVFYPITLADKHNVLNFTSEPILYTLARVWFDRGIIAHMYIDDVVNTEYQLSALSKTLHRRIDESKGKHLSYIDAKCISKMHLLVDTIDVYASHISLLSDYCTQHKTYFVMFDSEVDMHKKYEDLLRIIASGNSLSIKEYDIRHYVMWQYSAREYPYIAFVSDLRDDILLLKDTMKSLSYRYPERMYYAHRLVDLLALIEKVIVSDPCYAQEQQLQYEHERLERMRHEALKDKRRLERALRAAEAKHQQLCLSLML